jgi:hypothetical protein
VQRGESRSNMNKGALAKEDDDDDDDDDDEDFYDRTNNDKVKHTPFPLLILSQYLDV